MCTTSNIGRMHGKPKTNLKSHRKSKLSQGGLFFGASVHIFATSDVYSSNTCFREIKIKYPMSFKIVQQLQSICFYNVLTRFTNFNTLFGLCEKNTNKIYYNILSMHATKKILLKTKTSRLV